MATWTKGRRAIRDLLRVGDEGLETWLVAGFCGAALKLGRGLLGGRRGMEAGAVVGVGRDVVPAEEGVASTADGEEVVEIAGRERAVSTDGGQALGHGSQM